MSSNAGLGAGDNEGDSWPCSENDEESPYESEEDDGSGRTLLFLCEEGQLDTALQRVREWDERCPIERIAANATTGAACSTTTTIISETTTTKKSTDLEVTIKQELFRKNPSTGNYCLHEILAGGTSGGSAPELVERLVRRYRNYGITSIGSRRRYHCRPGTITSASTDVAQGSGQLCYNYQTVFRARPKFGSNGRTVLHWCAWCKTTPKILRLVLEADPESMCLRDNHSHGSRTPLEIAQRYWPGEKITAILEASEMSYLPHRLRICARMCAKRYFLWPSEDTEINHSRKDDEDRPEVLTPFDKKDRRIAGLAPRPWFVASVIGYALQREMEDLVRRILSFVGYGAKIDAGNRRGKKRKKKTPTTKHRDRNDDRSTTERKKQNP